MEEKINKPIHIGVLFSHIKQDFGKRLIDKLKIVGYDKINLPHLSVLANIIREDGIRLTEIADRLSITKQSVKDIIDCLETNNYLNRIPDPKDLRAKQLIVTEIGKQIYNDGMKASEEITKEYIEILGKDDFIHMENCIRKILSYSK